MEQKFKPFRCWPGDNWPVKEYEQPADCDEIKIAKNAVGNLHESFSDKAGSIWEGVMEDLQGMYPGWEADGCGLEGMSLFKEIPGDPRADDDGVVSVGYTCGMLGLNFAVLCDSGRVIDFKDYNLGDEFVEMAVEDYLMHKFQSDRLKFDWNYDEDVTVTTPDKAKIKYIVNKDIDGNVTLMEEGTRRMFPIKLINV